MSLRDQIGQRLIYRLPGVTRLTPEVADFLVECRAGGVVLFAYNIESPEQLSQLNSDLQELAARNGLPPFIIGIDEEGGQVSRLPAQGQSLIPPSQMAQGYAGAEAVKNSAAVIARRLRRFGFNLNFAPVVDINNNSLNPVIGIRSYGDDPYRVATLSQLAIEAYLQEGISPCVKHFPGHGNTSVDSHYGLPVVNKPMQELQDFELVPFQKAVIGKIPAIMSAHILYPQVEPNNLPATFSRVFLIDLLRHELGFEGLIFTDALDMGAIANQYGLGKATILALQAGVDVTLSFSMSFAEQRAAFEEVVAAAEAGAFNQAELDAATLRLEKWRQQFCIPPADTDTTETDEAIIYETAQKAITVVNSRPGYLPLSKLGATQLLLVDFTIGIASPAENELHTKLMLAQELEQVMPGLKHLQIGFNPTEDEVGKVREAAAQADLVIAVTRNALRHVVQANLVHELLSNQNNVPVIVIAARDPYDLQLFEEAPLSIAIYGEPPATVRALAELLTKP